LLKEDISNAEAFRADFKSFRRDRSALVVVEFLSVLKMSLPLQIYG
jgi:hypothetical protein